MSLPIQDQANILHAIRGGWTVRFEIIKALLLREVVNQSVKNAMRKLNQTTQSDDPDVTRRKTQRMKYKEQER